MMAIPEFWALAVLIAAGMLAVVGALWIVRLFLRNRSASCRPRRSVTVRTTHVESTEPPPALHATPERAPLPRAARSGGGELNLSELMRQLDALAGQVRGQVEERADQMRALLADAEGRLGELQAARDASAVGAQRMEQLAEQIARRLDQRTAAMEQLLAGVDAKIAELHSAADQAAATARQILSAAEPLHQQAASRTSQLQQLLDAAGAKAADLRATTEGALAGSRQMQEVAGHIQKAVEGRLSEMTELLEGADARLHELVGQVDARLAELRAATDAALQARAAQNTPPASQPAEPPKETLEQLAARWQPSAPPSQQAPAPAQSAPAGQDTPGAVSPKQMEIFRLYDQGLDAVEIARRLAMNIGSVELILNLRRSRERDLKTRNVEP